MAMLVFLAAAAGAWIVAPDLRQVPLHGDLWKLYFRFRRGRVCERPGTLLCPALRGSNLGRRSVLRPHRPGAARQDGEHVLERLEIRGAAEQPRAEIGR